MHIEHEVYTIEQRRYNFSLVHTFVAWEQHPHPRQLSCPSSSCLYADQEDKPIIGLKTQLCKSVVTPAIIWAKVWPGCAWLALSHAQAAIQEGRSKRGAGRVGTDMSVDAEDEDMLQFCKDIPKIVCSPLHLALPSSTPHMLLILLLPSIYSSFLTPTYIRSFMHT